MENAAEEIARVTGARNRSEVVARRDSPRAASVVRGVLAALLVGCLGFVGAPAAAADPASVQAQEWWIGRLGLHEAWQISKGAGVTVAVLDSGVDAGFGDLAGAVVAGFGSGGIGDGRTDTSPAIHGTRMADEIAGRGTGFGLLGAAPQAKILPVVIPTSHRGDATPAALNRLAAMAQPPQVVNMSYGTVGPCVPELQDAVRKAVDKGMILVAAAGNDGAGGNVAGTPADCAGVVAVGAYDHSLTAWPKSQRQPYVALAGPGVHMVGFYKKTGGVGYADGTSDAAAIVSGTFALVRAHFPTMPSRQLVARVLATARQFQGAQGTRNDVWGYGAARPHHALTDAVPASAPNPIYDAVDKLGGPSTKTPSRPSSPGSTQATGPVNPPNGSAAGPGSTPAEKEGGSSTGVVVAVSAAAAVALIVIALMLHSRRRRTPQYPPQPDYRPPGGYGPAP